MRLSAEVWFSRQRWISLALFWISTWIDGIHCWGLLLNDFLAFRILDATQSVLQWRSKQLFQELLSPLSNPRTALKLPIGFVIVTSTTVYTMGFVIVTSTTVYNNKFRIICSLTLLHLFLYGGGKQETQQEHWSSDCVWRRRRTLMQEMISFLAAHTAVGQAFLAMQ